MYIDTSHKPGTAATSTILRPRPVDPEATPSARILLAVEVIARHGPVTYAALEQSLKLSKATTWRLVATLHEARWVRFRHGGRMIELDPRLDELFATAHFADAEFLEVSDAMCLLASRFQVHCDLFAPSRQGELVLHETSRRLTSLAPMPEATDEALLLAVHAAMTPQQLERHLTRLAANLDVESMRQIKGAAARAKIESFPGYSWGHGGRYLAISLRGKMGTAAVLRLSTKANSIRPEVLGAVFAELATLLDGKVERLGAGQKALDLP